MSWWWGRRATEPLLAPWRERGAAPMAMGFWEELWESGALPPPLGSWGWATPPWSWGWGLCGAEEDDGVEVQQPMATHSLALGCLRHWVLDSSSLEMPVY